MIGNPFIIEADRSDPSIASAIRKNERTATLAKRLIAQRNKKLDPEKAFEAMANTIGIMAADVVRESAHIHPELPKVMRDLFLNHLDAALEFVEGKAKND